MPAADGLEILPKNRPNDTVFDWSFDPLMLVKEQMEIAALSPDEQRYVEAWVLSMAEADRFAMWLGDVEEPPSGMRRKELESFGRR